MHQERRAPVPLHPPSPLAPLASLTTPFRGAIPAPEAKPTTPLPFRHRPPPPGIVHQVARGRLHGRRAHHRDADPPAGAPRRRPSFFDRSRGDRHRLPDSVRADEISRPKLARAHHSPSLLGAPLRAADAHLRTSTAGREKGEPPPGHSARGAPACRTREPLPPPPALPAGQPPPALFYFRLPSFPRRPVLFPFALLPASPCSLSGSPPSRVALFYF